MLLRLSISYGDSLRVFEKEIGGVSVEATERAMQSAADAFLAAFRQETQSGEVRRKAHRAERVRHEARPSL